MNHNDREVELILRKKELKEEYWPRLLATDKKAHFLKTNFDKVCIGDWDMTWTGMGMAD